MKLPEYKDFAEKNAFFQIQHINTEKEFDEFYANISNKKYLFRGISNAKYKIFTSLQRYWFQYELKDKFNFDDFVKDYLREAKNTLLPAYFKGLDIPLSFLSIYSFLQHYHAPSALIDFTPNVDVALYFATENTPPTLPSESIDSYFSIFQIQESDFELISDNSALSHIGKIKDSWKGYTDKDGNNLFDAYLDNYIEMHTEKVFLVPNDIENKPVYNALSSLNIIAQQGLFIYNGYENEPLEEAFHKFFESATQFHYNIHDDLPGPESDEINRVYREETLPKNRANQARLKANIIHSYEISKSLAPYIKSKLTLTKENIYPNPDDIGWSMFNKVKDSK